MGALLGLSDSCAGFVGPISVAPVHVDIATFAIAGIGAAIGGSTGAVLTGIIMITEMTNDSSVTLPLVVTCAIAYAVRKLIMDENIYNMKLQSRGHMVPEGLRAASTPRSDHSTPGAD